jgi:hypothetical protein
MGTNTNDADILSDILFINSNLLDNCNQLRDSLELTKIDKLSWKSAYFKLEKIIRDIRRLSHSDTIDSLCDCIEYIDMPEEDEYLELSSSESSSESSSSSSEEGDEGDIVMNIDDLHILTDVDINRYKIYDILSNEFISNPGFINIVYSYFNVVDELNKLNNIDTNDEFIIKNIINNDGEISHYITNHAYLVSL